MAQEAEAEAVAQEAVAQEAVAQEAEGEAVAREGVEGACRGQQYYIPSIPAFWIDNLGFSLLQQ